MGRRSRKRAQRTPEVRSERAGAAAPRPRPGTGEPPPAPWGSFPLVEICILLGLVLIVGGFVGGGRRGHLAVASGVALASLAALELSIREHLAGYRSHTTLLAAGAAVATIVVLFFARVPRGAMLAAGALVFAAVFVGLRELFKRRSGGFGFR